MLGDLVDTRCQGAKAEKTYSLAAWLKISLLHDFGVDRRAAGQNVLMVDLAWMTGFLCTVILVILGFTTLTVFTTC